MIELNSVGKQFEDRWILRNVNLRVQEGESIAWIGPSGSGKTVLLKLLAGLLNPDEGSVRVQTSDIGMLFQKNALFDSLTVEDNLLFPLREKKGITGPEAREISTRYLRAVGLHGNGSLYPDELSGGMQKRLGIARALILKPRVILYDEPTAGLDPITSRSIAELILDLQHEERSTVISITNDVQRAMQLGKRIFLVAQGRLTEGGSPEEVRETRDPALQQFIYGLPAGPLSGGLS